MKKKIAIVTIQSTNFGNRLQNYALQEVLLSLGYSVETLKRVPPTSNMDKVKLLPREVIQYILNTKASKFKKFNKFIIFSKQYVYKDRVSDNLKNMYDYFIAGSDQIWNPYFEIINTIDFLTFAKPDQKIAYAASFGVSNLPVNKIDEYKKYLSDFRSISVREVSGANIIRNLLQIDVPVVLDPTLLLTAKQWQLVEKKVKVPGKYALIYLLGKNEEKLKLIKDVLRKQGIDVFLDIKRKNKFNRDWEIGPSEFLYLIHNASFIVTDSFHGTVFSFLYHKPVVILEREGVDMFSRIETLLKLFDLDELKFDEKNSNQFLNVNIDYSLIEQKLDEKRKESLEYLKNSFS